MKKYLALTLLILPKLALAQAWQTKVTPSVFDQIQQRGKTEILVEMREQADLSAADRLETKAEKGEFVFRTLSQFTAQSQSDIQQLLRAQSIDFQSFWINNSLFLKANFDLLKQLAERSDVLQITNNPHSQLNLSNAPLSTPEALQHTWGIKKIKADSVWALGIRGQNVVIGGADTGYEWGHPAVRKKYRGYIAARDTADHNYNWFDAILNDTITATNPCGAPSKRPCDDHSHGTHTMGTMAGGNVGDTLAIGVAPDAKWIGARNMDRGDGTLARYVACFEWFIAPKDSLGRNPNPNLAPHVINNSWACTRGEGCNESNFAILDRALNACRSAGIVVVVSVGNSGSNCSSAAEPPGFFAKAFSIGATASNDTIAGFSSRGVVTVDSSRRIKPDVSAPGVSVYSSVLRGGYANYSGTSMAGPHVAGAVALMISANPKLAGQVDTIQRILELTAKQMRTAQDCGGISGQSIPNNTYGYGRIDVLAAVRRGLLYKNNVKTIENQLVSQIKVFPNPFSSEISFDTEGGNFGEISIQIFNTKGQLVAQQKTNQPTLKLGLPIGSSGVYFYKISSVKGVQSGKLVRL